MSTEPTWRRYLRFWKPEVERDVDDELRFHFESRIAELVARGAPTDEARRMAAEEFGDVRHVRAELRVIGERRVKARARFLWWDALRADLRFAARGVARQPLFSLTIVLTLAVGIGATTAMYGVMRRLLLSPPPHIAEPDRVRRMLFELRGRDGTAHVFGRHSYPLLEKLTGARTLASVAAYMPGEPTVVGQGTEARTLRATLVSAGFWRTLGARPALGRFFADEEAHPATGRRVAVLSHALFEREFGADPGVIGRALHVRGQPYVIIGVAPRGFRGVELSDTEIWLPLLAYADGDPAERDWWQNAGNLMLFVARVRDDAAVRAAIAELEHLRWTGENDMMRGQVAGDQSVPRARPVHLVPLTGAIGANGRPIPEATVVVWVVGVACVLLLIAWANVSGLLLVRALRRRREIAVRLALGMSQGRLATLLLVEGGMLALLGGLASLVVAAWGGGWVRAVLLDGMLGEVPRLDARMLALAGGCTLAVTLLAGLAPLARSVAGASGHLKEGGRGSARRPRLQVPLLVAQTALSTMLLVGAGLFLRSLHAVRTTDLGLEIDDLYVARVEFAGTGLSREGEAELLERMLAHAAALPGVRRAALAIGEPVGGWARSGSIRLAGSAERWRGSDGLPSVNYVTPGFFEAAGMRLSEGRTFAAGERTARVVVVNDAFAREAWPGRSPLGECVYVGPRATECSYVVGVVSSTRSFRESGPLRRWFFVPLAPEARERRVLLVRTAASARRMDATLARELQRMEPGMPHVQLRPLAALLEPQVRPWRLGATVFTALAMSALLLAALGLYGALAFAVAQRSHEIGVRMAVGARGTEIVRLVLADGLRLAAAGVGVGLLVALFAAPALAGQLHETSPRDLLVLSGAAVSLLSVAVAASVVPARRASRVDPLTALRAD